MTPRVGLTCLVTALLGGLVSPVFAHPHVWVTAKAEVVHDQTGNVTGIRHTWTFDKSYSAYVTQGLDKDSDGKLTSEELKDLAKENTESLVDFDYFTDLKVNGKKQEFGFPHDHTMVYANEAVSLSYFLPLKVRAAAKTASLEVHDPSFFISFSLAEGNDAVTLASAPRDCAINITRPTVPDSAQQQSLQSMSETLFQSLTVGSKFGTQFANRAIIACP